MSDQEKIQTPDHERIQTISISKLTRGFLVQGAASPNTLGAMSIFSAACKTPTEVLENVAELLGLEAAVQQIEATVEPIMPATGLQLIKEEPVPVVEQTVTNVGVFPYNLSPITAENREAVMKFLETRGCELVKGVRTTTLTKLLEVELKKFKAEEQTGELPLTTAEPKTEDPAAEVSASVKAPAGKPAIRPVCRLCLGTGFIMGDIECKHPALDGDGNLTMEIVRAAVNTILNKNMDKRADITKAASVAVGKLGVTRFPEIKDFNAAWPVIRAGIEAVLTPAKKEDDEWVM